MNDTITWKIIVNPAGGNGKVRQKWTHLERLLHQLDFSFEVAFTTQSGHAIQLAKEAIESGFRYLMAVGGDGTNNEVINGIMQQKVVDSQEITYTLLPVGTGNDWVKTHQIPKEAETWLRQISTAKTILHDIGQVNYFVAGAPQKRYFINVAGMAYDAFVTRYAESRKHLASNPFFYYFMIMRCLFQYKLQRARVQIDDGDWIENEFYTINVGISRYSGGGMQFVPHAKPDDGILAVTLAGKLSKLGVLLATPYFYNGKLDEHPVIDIYEGKKIRVEALSDTPTLLEVDGEFLGETPVEFTILPKALRVIVP